MRVTCLSAAILYTLVFAAHGRADELRTSLIIEGGGLHPYCPALDRLVEASKINGRIRIGYLPTASTNPARSASRFVQRLSVCGVQPEQIQVIDLSLENAATRAEDLNVVAQIRECTAIFFGGGDQTRITRALMNADGTPSAALKAIYDVWRGGAVIAGTSAGAAVQSQTMISVAGLPDDLIDDGMDALDFGLVRSLSEPARRGLHVTRGLGFFQHGIIDQHFTQYRGRLGRLARAAIEQKVRFGFGIDEDAALVLATDGTTDNIEILGPGFVTIVDTAGATCRDSALGCSIAGVHLSCLGHGDRFDPTTARITIHSGKKRIESGHESNNGNFLIPDIAGRGAVPLALIEGLGNNTSKKQLGIMLKHNRHYSHGYQFTFSKTDQTQGHEGIVNGFPMAAVTHVRLDIEPVSHSLKSPETGLPRDFSEEPARNGLEAILFRGIMLADEDGRFRPRDPITNGELASALAETIHLEMPRSKSIAIKDVAESSPGAHEITLVVATGLMPLEDNAFKPLASVSRNGAVAVLVRLAERYFLEDTTTKFDEFKDGKAIRTQHRNQVIAGLRKKYLIPADRGNGPPSLFTRAEAAEAIFSIIGFPWAE